MPVRLATPTSSKDAPNTTQTPLCKCAGCVYASVSRRIPTDMHLCTSGLCVCLTLRLLVLLRTSATICQSSDILAMHQQHTWNHHPEHTHTHKHLEGLVWCPTLWMNPDNRGTSPTWPGTWVHISKTLQYSNSKLIGTCSLKTKELLGKYMLEWKCFADLLFPHSW